GLEATAKELAERGRVDDRPGEEVRSGLLALFEHGYRNVAETLTHLRVLVEELPEADRTREPARAGPDDRDSDVDPRLRRIGRRTDRVDRPERRCEVDGSGHGPSASRARELRELRHDLVQVADDADVAEVEDRRVRVLVDRDDGARALHPDLVLDRARDPASD